MSDPTSQGYTEQDSVYTGSTFSAVRNAIFSNPYYVTWGAAGEPPLPVYRVTLRSLLKGMLPFGSPLHFLQAAQRTLDSRADLRWGSKGQGVPRLLHPNGICLVGKWRITAETAYSGYFKRNSEGLVIARYSTCCSETRRGYSRSLSLVGKLFPVTDPTSDQKSIPAAFITQQDLGGEYSDYINDAETRSAPDTTAWRRNGVSGPAILALTGIVFGRADREPDKRQLYEIAELGKSTKEKTLAPEFLRFIVAEDQVHIEGENLDFRDEIMSQIYDRGDSTPQRTLTFNIEVTDKGESHGLPIKHMRIYGEWQRIGCIEFSEAVVSYNGDHVIHFHHPTWRTDRNDPNTAIRKHGKRIRR